MPARPATACLLLAAVAAGCDRVVHRAETTLHPDGSVTRTVVQQNLRWDEAVAPDREPVVNPDPGGWPRPLASLPKVDPDDDGAENAAADERAAARFESAAAMPSPLGSPVGDAGERFDVSLSAETDVRAFGFFTLYDWRETLSAGTNPVRMERARRRGVDLAAWYAPAVLAAGFEGKGEIDAAALAGWVRTTGDDWSADLQAAFFASPWAHPDRLPLGDPKEIGEKAYMLQAFRPLAEVCADYGLVLTDGDEPLPQDAAFEHFAAVVLPILRGRVRLDGRVLTSEELDRAFGLLFLRGPDGSRADGLEYDGVAASVLAARFGSAEAAREELTPLAGEWWGAGADIFRTHSLEYVHRQPGLLLATDGEVLDAGGADLEAEVLFRFPFRYAHPFGRPMRCRTVLIDAGSQREAFGELVLADRRAVLHFLDLHAGGAWRAEWDAALQSADAPRMRRLLLREPGGDEDIVDIDPAEIESRP